MEMKAIEQSDLSKTDFEIKSKSFRIEIFLKCFFILSIYLNVFLTVI